jgi:hypothetical protein
MSLTNITKVKNSLSFGEGWGEAFFYSVKLKFKPYYPLSGLKPLSG